MPASNSSGTSMMTTAAASQLDPFQAAGGFFNLRWMMLRAALLGRVPKMIPPVVCVDLAVGEQNGVPKWATIWLVRRACEAASPPSRRHQ
jgi:hypothetical protein